VIGIEILIFTMQLVLKSDMHRFVYNELVYEF